MKGYYMQDHTIQMAVGKYKDLKQDCAVLIVIQGQDIGRDYRLRKSEYIIGRDGDCDIVIPESTVSRKHAKIQVIDLNEHKEHEYRLIDIKSTNKTYVNNTEADDVVLKSGDKIRVGDTILKFELLDDIDIKYHKEIRDKIRYDSLTRLLTKDSLCLALHHELQRCIQYNLPLSVVMMELDHIKNVNDTLGHEAASYALQEIASLVRSHLRKTDVSGRFGGEVFLSYLSEQPKEKAKIAADYLRMVIENASIVFASFKISVTASVGIAQFPVDGITIEELIAKADTALYKAKNGGRNQVCLA
jgi:diguanylate cyclase (GGDEF)-like protein